MGGNQGSILRAAGTVHSIGRCYPLPEALGTHQCTTLQFQWLCKDVAAHLSSFSNNSLFTVVNSLFTVVKGGLGSCKRIGGGAIFSRWVMRRFGVTPV